MGVLEKRTSRERTSPARRRRRIPSDDQGMGSRRRRVSCRGRRLLRAERSTSGSAGGAARGRSGGAGVRTSSVAVAFAAATAIAAWISGQVEQLAAGAATSAGEGQSTLALDDPGAAVERPATISAVACVAARAAPATAPALAAVQEPAARAAAAGARTVPALSPDAARATTGAAQTVAADESGAAAPVDSAPPPVPHRNPR